DSVLARRIADNAARRPLHHTARTATCPASRGGRRKLADAAPPFSATASPVTLYRHSTRSRPLSQSVSTGHVACSETRRHVVCRHFSTGIARRVDRGRASQSASTRPFLPRTHHPTLTT